MLFWKSIKKLSQCINAGSYFESLIPEAMVKFSKENVQQLIRYYDLYELCKWKDQCERDNAAVKSILHSYVDSRNSILQVEDIHLALETYKPTRWN